MINSNDLDFFMLSKNTRKYFFLFVKISGLCAYRIAFKVSLFCLVKKGSLNLYHQLKLFHEEKKMQFQMIHNSEDNLYAFFSLYLFYLQFCTFCFVSII